MMTFIAVISVVMAILGTLFSLTGQWNAKYGDFKEATKMFRYSCIIFLILSIFLYLMTVRLSSYYHP